MKKKNLILIGIVIILIIALVATGLLLFKKKEEGPKDNERKITRTLTNEYVAYLKINPSFKLNYTEECTAYSDNTIECKEPIVKTYELVNDDAKELFNDINLLEEKNNLADVINLIVKTAKEKGINTDNVEINSDWEKIDTYLKEENTSENEEASEVEYNYSISVEEAATINNEITTDINAEEEKKAKEAEEARIKAEEEAKKKAEEEKKKKAAAEALAKQTINLNDNVTFCHSMQTFECDNCFSSSLISTLKKAKGHSITEATASRITIKRITSLSGSYNSTTYFGTGLISKITSAGGEEVGGAGGCEEPVTSAICSEFNLICK